MKKYKLFVAVFTTIHRVKPALPDESILFTSTLLMGGHIGRRRQSRLVHYKGVSRNLFRRSTKKSNQVSRRRKFCLILSAIAIIEQLQGVLQSSTDFFFNFYSFSDSEVETGAGSSQLNAYLLCRCPDANLFDSSSSGL